MLGLLTMRIKSLLVHRCDTIFQSEESTETDPYGRPIFSEIKAYDVICRLDSVQERIVPDDTGNDILITHMMTFSPENEPLTNMRIENIRDKHGFIVLRGTFRVVSINPVYGRRVLHHYEVDLTKDG